jgi:hypothetical protein
VKKNNENMRYKFNDSMDVGNENWLELAQDCAQWQASFDIGVLKLRFQLSCSFN